jgi:hypothetical protein
MLATELLFVYVYCLVDDAINPVQQIDTSALPVTLLPGPPVPISGPARATTWPLGSAATARMLIGSTDSGWRCALTWAAGSCGPGRSCPQRSMSGRSVPI